METVLPTLQQSLQGRDLSFLRIIAEQWGIELQAPDTRSGLQRLPPLMLSAERVAEVVELLPEKAREALRNLVAHEGRISWAQFSRSYGNIREMGPARRDREQPYYRPASPAEALWYRALIGRAFFDTPTGPQEFTYIPSDLLDLLPVERSQAAVVLGRPATLAERANPIQAGDRILDHACTYLAALRAGMPPDALQELENTWESPSPYPLSVGLLHAILGAAGLIDSSGQIQGEPVRAFLEAGRAAALLSLVEAWLHSPVVDELRLIPGITAEGSEHSDPLRTRQLILDFLSSLPEGSWWSLSAFVNAVHESYPDYQRPSGDYDSWFIKSESGGEYLRGFAHWDEVDGALLRYMIGGPMFWLGLMDLASPDPAGIVSAFRFSGWSKDLLRGQAPAGLPGEDQTLKVGSDARLRVPRLAPRALRYQLSRFGEWEGTRGDDYLYRLTPASLESARQQGLRASHLLGLLRRSAGTVPPSLGRALERWEERGSEVRLERVTVLRLSSPELMKTLRASRAGRFLGDPLGPTAVVVHPGAWKKVMAALAEMGYLAEVRDLGDSTDQKEAP